MARRRRVYGDVQVPNLAFLGLAGFIAYLLLRKDSSAAVPAQAPASPLFLETAYDMTASQAATNEAQCKAAGGVWIKTGLFGIGSAGFCTDPQRSSAACAQAGGTWVGTGCSFPNSTGL